MGNQGSEKRDRGKLVNLNNLNLSAIFENTTDSVWAINPNYEILYANNIFSTAFYEHFGIPICQGTNLLDSLPGPIKAVWKSRYDRALSNESFSFVDHVEVGNISTYIEVFMNPIVSDGIVVGAMFFGKDITKRMQDEKALIESQLLLKASLESQRDTILFSIDKAYRYLYFNSAHAQVMKHAYGAEIEIGMSILDCITSDDDRPVAKENYDRALRGESHCNVREYGAKNLAYYESFFNPIYNDKNEIIGATALARDITERKKTELALVASERELKELSATKDKLFSVIAHDLRSPFSSILGLSDLLIEKSNDASFAESGKYLNLIYSSAKNTLILLDNLLNWAKLQTGKIYFNPVGLNFSVIVSEVLKLETTLAEAKNISLNYLTTDPVVAYADAEMLKIVLRNLISNAIKFTRPGGEIHVTAKQLGDFIEIDITDNGIGMNEDHLEKLFHLSSDTRTLGTANEKGSGFGLLLCKDFIEKHNGKIWAESKAGIGTSFKFTLPIAERRI
ncbi:ATP-binding protein [Mangrovibacterium sp.]|uniref:sensor histidine kinase n=1 Tax=Mangrovibacterium sp. TaxID=1961364 RepID=UPI003566DD7C